MENSSPTLDLGSEVLQSPVRRVLQSDTAEIETWEARSLGKRFNAVTGGIFRVVGSVRDHGASVPWSIILKICRDPNPGATIDQRKSNYWKREFLAYRSQILDELPPGIRAARCFGAAETREGEAWLWLEDLEDTHPSGWPLERYALAARHAGQLNGAYLAGRQLPEVPWLSAGVARSYVETFGYPIERLAEFADDPLVRRSWPDGKTAERAVPLWRERELFFTALARLPQTLGHLDLFKDNLFAIRAPDGRDETVAIDWAFLGTAAVGEELACLVCSSVIITAAHVASVRELGELAFESYLEGLREAGWDGDARLARLGYTAGAIRYTATALALLARVEPDFAARVTRGFGELIDRGAILNRYTLDLADEARVLMAQL